MLAAFSGGGDRADRGQRAGIEHDAFVRARRDGMQLYVEFYKGKIKDMSDRTELLQEKADDLERVKRYAGAEQIDTIIRKVKEQERTEQQIRRYDRSYGTR